ncbi:MAG TPA: efflux RND transporter permease subunit [Nitrospiraceae bacterium]|nr:efflux RND transporter permease subunit [Nitrospiraceae bacterium]
MGKHKRLLGCPKAALVLALSLLPSFLFTAKTKPLLRHPYTSSEGGRKLTRVDRDKVLKQGVNLPDVYQTLQSFMGRVMVNFFDRFGRVWQDDVQAEGEFRTQAENVGQFYVRNANSDMVPLTALVTMETFHGPEFTTRYNEYRTGWVRTRQFQENRRWGIFTSDSTTSTAADNHT